VAADDEPTAEEREALALARRLIASADTGPLIASLRAGDGGPERARDALALLAELDPDLIVQVALDALIQAHLSDPAAARQSRRVVRDDP
jgi:hypothetical protein